MNTVRNEDVEKYVGGRCKGQSVDCRWGKMFRGRIQKKSSKIFGENEAK